MHLSWPPSSREQEEVWRSQIRGMRRVIKHSYHLLSQELAHMDCTVCRGIIVEQHPFSSPVQLWLNPLDTLWKCVQNCLVKCSSNGLTCTNEFLMNGTFVVEEGDKQCFDLEFFADDSFMVEGKSVNNMSSIAF